MSGRINCDIVRTWQNAVEAVEGGRLEEAVSLFREIQHFSAKILFNLSTVDILQGNLAAAYEKLKECVQKDEYLVVAHFQKGVIACRQDRLMEARETFARAEKNLRNSDSIDYKQLGLDLRLTRQQVLHNMTVVDNYLRSNRQTTEIPERELEVLPHASLFRPARSLVDNIEKRNFLKSAKVISAVPEIPRNKHGNVIRPAQSSSAPTSPCAQRRLGLNSQPPAARTPPPSRPPPSRPPPRLPPSSLPHSGDSRHHDDGARQEMGSKEREQQMAVVAPRLLSDGVSSSCLSASAVQNRPVSKGHNPSQTVTQLGKGQPSQVARQPAKGSLRGEDGAAHRHDIPRAVVANSFSPLSPSSPSDQLGEKNRTGRTSSSDLTVAERIRMMETSNPSQGQAACGVKSTVICRRPDQEEDVRGERSWSESGTREVASRSKPARPPPPKFVS